MLPKYHIKVIQQGEDSMKMTEETLEKVLKDGWGYCLVCNDITRPDTKPDDALNYVCPVCGYSTVMGVRAALVDGHIQLVDSDEEMDDEYDCH